MDLYRRIAAIRSESDADDLVDELIDRYGEPPRTVNNLITVALLRAAAMACGITSIDQKGENLLLTIPEFDFETVIDLCSREKYLKRLVLLPGDVARVSLKLRKDESGLKAARTLIGEYAEGLNTPEKS